MPAGHVRKPARAAKPEHRSGQQEGTVKRVASGSAVSRTKRSRSRGRDRQANDAAPKVPATKPEKPEIRETPRAPRSGLPASREVPSQPTKPFTDDQTIYSSEYSYSDSRSNTPVHQPLKDKPVAKPRGRGAANCDPEFSPNPKKAKAVLSAAGKIVTTVLRSPTPPRMRSADSRGGKIRRRSPTPDNWRWSPIGKTGPGWEEENENWNGWDRRDDAWGFDENRARGKGGWRKGWGGKGGKAKGKGESRSKGNWSEDGADGSSGISRIHVANLPRSTTEDRLRQMFVPFGKVLGVKILSPRGGGGSPTCSAIVRFGTASAAEAAIRDMSGRPEGPRGDPLEVKLARPNPKWEAPM